jgi:FkbH-like protein
MIAMYRTVCQTDAVKMVVVDLDDTLWNGVATEMDYVGPEIAEGWPLGMIEALVYLKKRGVLLGLLSKNDEQRVSEVWDRVYGPRFPFSSFAAKIINWQAKSDNMRSLLRTVNLLARNVVYVDDHPAERAAMKAAFPEMRVLDGLHYYWRKTLLWAPETQSSHITEESVRRRETIQARADLEAASNGLTDREFQMFQRLRIQIERIAPEHGARQRAFELLNKTNQFNTTGRRWTVQEFSSFIGGEGTVYIVTAWDRFTPYGVVAVVLTEGPVIRQFVMSCRIFGRQVEIATLAQIIAQIKELGEVSADSHDTDANSPCRDLFRRMGFQWQDRWVLKGSATPVPDFIECRFVDANDGATTR